MPRKLYEIDDRYHRALSKAKIDLGKRNIGAVIEAVIDGDRDAVDAVRKHLADDVVR